MVRSTGSTPSRCIYRSQVQGDPIAQVVLESITGEVTTTTRPVPDVLTFSGPYQRIALVVTWPDGTRGFGNARCGIQVPTLTPAPRVPSDTVTPTAPLTETATVTPTATLPATPVGTPTATLPPPPPESTATSTPLPPRPPESPATATLPPPPPETTATSTPLPPGTPTAAPGTPTEASLAPTAPATAVPPTQPPPSPPTRVPPAAISRGNAAEDTAATAAVLPDTGSNDGLLWVMLAIACWMVAGGSLLQLRRLDQDEVSRHTLS